MTVLLTFVLNGEETSVAVEPGETLLRALRERLQLTGTKEGCDEGECGACTVLLDGKSVDSCLVLAPTVEGREVVTIEGLAHGERLHAIQQAFVEENGAQCGICTPGMVMAAADLLTRRPDPSDDEIREAIAGNLCRCTGYTTIVASVRSAATAMRRED
ncbi:MAG: (2Fe-2S)-binding protein [Gaiellaceae bacterium]